MTVRNMFRTRRYALSEVHDIRVVEESWRKAVLVPREGKAVGITGLEPPNALFRPNNTEANRLCADAMATVEAYRRRDAS